MAVCTDDIHQLIRTRGLQQAAPNRLLYNSLLSAACMSQLNTSAARGGTNCQNARASYHFYNTS